MTISETAKEYTPKIIQWRRDLHQIPELEKDLFKTSDYLKKQLDDLGIPWVVMSKTGLCGLIEGSRPGKTIALRADMDALLIKEETGLPFASQNGNMHACGHDAHMSILLATASILKNMDFAGNVKLFFQPDEEKDGGAQYMIEEGCLENPHVDGVLALHVGDMFPGLETGQIGVKNGPLMAAVDQFYVTVSGIGGHGAKPESTTDPILCTANMVCALHQIVAREISPMSPSVLSVGAIKGGDLFNIIPSQVQFCGTVRTTNADDRRHIEDRIKEICAHIAAAGRCSADVNYVYGHPATVNDKDFTDRVRASAAKIIGKENVIELEKPTMVAEDMSYFLEKVPGSYFYLCTQNPQKNITYPAHNSKFNVDEEILWEGAAIMVQTVIDFLGE